MGKITIDLDIPVDIIEHIDINNIIDRIKRDNVRV